MAQNGAKTTDAAAHEVTVGVSLGDSRELRFKHLGLLGWFSGGWKCPGVPPPEEPPPFDQYRSVINP